MTEVRLIGVTQPGTLGLNGNYFDPNIKTPEDIMIYCARVSNPANQNNMETGPKLLKYCIKNKHWSVFETVSVTMEITTTRDIARQILRHRSFSFQEFSQRYAVSESYEFRSARKQDTKNRQNSLEIEENDPIHYEWHSKQYDLINAAMDAYKWALENGIAKEQARAVLPEGMIQTKLYMSGTLRSWVTYISLREKSGTQAEHMEVAWMCKKILGNVFPHTVEALGGINNEWIV
jgi:thymidylate synthase (FAD)